MNRSELAKEIYNVAYIRGNFKLRSGTTSTEYFDKYRFESQPKLLDAIATHFAEKINSQFKGKIDFLAGLELGGVPIATAISLKTGIPTLFVRKKAKDYGTCQFAEGAEFKGKRLLIIEDVVTTGGQVVLSTKDLRDAGAIVDSCFCVILRGDDKQLKEIGLNLNPLFTMDELKAMKDQ